jgi:DNA invertase Pin-like site-specific DNA recombinase
MAAGKLVQLGPGASVFGYGRDSGGKEQERSLTDQRAAVLTYCAQQGYQLVHWYADEAKVGSDADNRPDFQEMIAVCRQERPPVAAVIVWDLARLSRAVLDRQFYMADLRRRGIQVVSLKGDENIAADNPIGGVIESVLAYADEEYLRTLARNVQRGMQASTVQGRTHGNRPPAGYAKTFIEIGRHRDGSPRRVQRWVIDPARADLVREAFRLYADGAGILEIHNRTQLLTYYSSYRDFFRNPLYVGTVRLGPLTQQDETLRIVDDTTWQACQARRLDPIPPRRVSSPYLLSGIIRCGRCGYVMWGREMKSNWQPELNRYNRYYRCSNSKRPGHYCNTATRCEPVDAQVREEVLTRLTSPDHVAQIVATMAERAARDPVPALAASLDAAVERAERAIANLLDLAETGSLALPTIRQRLAEREAELADLRARRAAVPAARTTPFDAEQVRERLLAFGTVLGSDADVGILRRVLSAVVERVNFTPPDNVEVVFREVLGVE